MTTSNRLPPPERWAICRMNEIEVAEMIERHIDHYAVDKDGNRHSVHLPKTFVQHYMKRDDGVLPTTKAYATMPIVLGSGELLAPTGLDRLRGIQFLIPDAVRAIIPKKEDCGPEQVKAAMNFLCGEWLVDVTTSAVGKATIIALALTLIERIMLNNRPCFSITAGRRGTGKTTLIMMLIRAVTGVTATAAAWSPSEEERRKAIMSYLVRGEEYLLWDNIPRGTQISCRYVVMSCTAETYSDRILGVTGTANVPATTIHIFTGNNTEVRGELASRNLTIRLDADRADPENRAFTHPDPIGWTTQHRGKILAAFYTILLGNPQLKEAPDAPGKTRFKIWWRLVGSAVEHAAKLAGMKAVTTKEADEAQVEIKEDIDFEKVFVEQEEEGDEDTASLSDALDILARAFPKEGFWDGFKAADVAGLVNTSDLAAYGIGNKDKNTGVNDDDRHALREFLFPGVDPYFKFSSRTMTRVLKRHLNEPVKMGDCTLALRKSRDKHTKVDLFHVESLPMKVGRDSEFLRASRAS